MYIVYFLVALFATTLGSIIGLGGGIIIKPLLDTLNDYKVDEIVFLSSCTVLSMAVVSSYKNIKKDKSILNSNSYFLIIGSIIGGLIGSNLFNQFLNYFSNQEVVQKIQSFLLIMIIIYVLVTKKKNKQFQIKKTKFNFCLSGIFMGVISSFLGIGGGPVNMSILVLGFGFCIKTGAMYSTLTILFSQLVSLFNYFYLGSSLFEGYQIVFIMILGGVLGGMFASKLSNIFSDKRINQIFVVTLTCLIFLNLNTLLK